MNGGRSCDLWRLLTWIEGLKEGRQGNSSPHRAAAAPGEGVKIKASPSAPAVLPCVFMERKANICPHRLLHSVHSSFMHHSQRRKWPGIHQQVTDKL